jgi:hypothetical protein
VKGEGMAQRLNPGYLHPWRRTYYCNLAQNIDLRDSKEVMGEDGTRKDVFSKLAFVVILKLAG